MGFRVRKSISLGKGVRINLGKNGISSVSFGKRGAPHVTVGKRGTYVGATIPGTGISYSHKISDNKHAKSSSSGSTKESHGKRSADSTYATMPEDEQVRVVPPSETYRGTHQTDAFATTEPSSFAGPSGGGAGEPPVDPSDGGHASHGKQPGKWKRRITLVIVAFVALCVGVGISDPTSSTQYRDLQSQLTEQRQENDKLKKQVSELNKQIDGLQDLKNQLDQQKSEQDKRQQEQDERQSQLDAREKNIAQREEAKKQAQEQAVQAAQKAQAEQQAQAQAQAQAEQRAQAQAAQAQAPQQNQTVSSGLAHGGAFCSPAGATAQSDRSSSILTCRTASDGRLRWQR